MANYHKWGYIIGLILLLGGESGSGKSKRVLYGLIYKFLGETTKDSSIHFIDGKGEKII